MAKSEKIILTEAMVYSASALGIHIVKDIAITALERQPGMTLSAFMDLLTIHEARIKETQTVKTTVEDGPITPDVITLQVIS